MRYALWIAALSTILSAGCGLGDRVTDLENRQNTDDQRWAAQVKYDGKEPDRITEAINARLGQGSQSLAGGVVPVSPAVMSSVLQQTTYVPVQSLGRTYYQYVGECGNPNVPRVVPRDPNVAPSAYMPDEYVTPDGTRVEVLREVPVIRGSPSRCVPMASPSVEEEGEIPLIPPKSTTPAAASAQIEQQITLHVEDLLAGKYAGKAMTGSCPCDIDPDQMLKIIRCFAGGQGFRTERIHQDSTGELPENLKAQGFYQIVLPRGWIQLASSRQQGKVFYAVGHGRQM